MLGNYEAIRQATEVNAEILDMGGELGVVRAGALADLVVVDEDPLADIGLLAGQGAHVQPVVERPGRAEVMAPVVLAREAEAAMVREQPGAGPHPVA